MERADLQTGVEVWLVVSNWGWGMGERSETEERELLACWDEMWFSLPSWPGWS